MSDLNVSHGGNGKPSGPDSDGQPAAPNLTVLVIGHTHHARLVVDHTANLVLMDCDPWA